MYFMPLFYVLIITIVIISIANLDPPIKVQILSPIHPQITRKLNQTIHMTHLI